MFKVLVADTLMHSNRVTYSMRTMIRLAMRSSNNGLGECQVLLAADGNYTLRLYASNLLIKVLYVQSDEELKSYKQ